MSKSSLTGISPHDLIATFGSDGYRYYFMREISFGQDGEFSWESMVDRYNSDLANDFGNLVSRVTSMIGRYLEGTVPDAPSQDELTDAEFALIDVHSSALQAMTDSMDEIAPHEAAKAVWSLVRKANSYVEEVAPWALAKEEANRRRLEVVLYELAEALRLLALMVGPFMPRAGQELWSRLGQEGLLTDARLADHGSWGLLQAGTKIATGDPLFPRLEEAKTA